MSSAHAHHHHPAPRGFSLLRASALTRLGIAAAGAAVVWLAVVLALGWV